MIKQNDQGKEGQGRLLSISSLMWCGKRCRYQVGESTRFMRRYTHKGVFIEKGPFFHGKGASRAPQTPHGTSPDGPSPKGGGFTENPSKGSPKTGEGGGLVSVWNLGSARGPFTVRKRPLSMKTPSHPPLRIRCFKTPR